MNVLWDESPAAVKQVQERLTAVKPMAYNTVLTIIAHPARIRALSVSEREGRSDLYRPVVTREDMGRRSLGESHRLVLCWLGRGPSQPTTGRPVA